MHARSSLKVIAGAALLSLVLSQAAGEAPRPTSPAAAATSPAAAATSQAAAATFRSRCTACHTYGKGVKVGPDLAGVTARRPRAWLRRFIHSSSTMIAAGDPTATALFEKFAHRRMPDWTDLSPAEIDGLLDYLAAGGPERKAPDERDAEEAGPRDAARGRALFAGAERLSHGGPACTACHALPGGAWYQGGSLGPDLAAAWPRYRDQPLTEYLRHHAPTGVGGRPGALAPEEIFALKAFLRQVAQPPAAARRPRPTTRRTGGR